MTAVDIAWDKYMQACKAYAEVAEKHYRNAASRTCSMADNGQLGVEYRNGGETIYNAVRSWVVAKLDHEAKYGR